MTSPATELRPVNVVTDHTNGRSDLARASDLSTGRVLALLGALFLLNFLLRAVYLRFQFVNGDEAVRALTATGVLDGARLYVDIITDKPPGTTWFYAGVFALFGRSMAAVHLAAIAWNFGTALVVYGIAARSYSRRAGVWAAALFVYFSSNYLTQDMMAANTELLMALPAAAAFYFYLAGHGLLKAPQEHRKRELIQFGLAGFFAGIAVLFKQLGLFALPLFALCEGLIFWLNRGRQHATPDRPATGLVPRLLAVALGFAIPIAGLILWLFETGAMFGFWRNAVELGAFYVRSLPAGLWIKFMLTRANGYILFNLALWIPAALAAWRAVQKGRWKQAKDGVSERSSHIALVSRKTLIDLMVLLWAVISLAGVFTSGRFYGHYFIQALPPLAILGVRGTLRLLGLFRRHPQQRSVRIALATVAFFLLVGFVRFHHRTLILAYEQITGAQTQWGLDLGIARREKDAAQMAEFVRGRVGEGEPLYIWGYALDVYWRSGCRVASRYLTPYYVTGHFYPEVGTSGDTQNERFWREARGRLLEDLRRNRPRLILNVDEAIDKLPYPEIVDFMQRNYVPEGRVGSDPARQFVVYRLKE